MSLEAEVADLRIELAETKEEVASLRSELDVSEKWLLEFALRLEPLPEELLVDHPTLGAKTPTLWWLTVKEFAVSCVLVDLLLLALRQVRVALCIQCPLLLEAHLCLGLRGREFVIALVPGLRVLYVVNIGAALEGTGIPLRRGSL